MKSSISGRKAQMALEYIITYGWAFVAMLVAIAALSYFGVFSPSTYIPERCTFPQEFKCIDFLMNESGAVKVDLFNGMGRAINITSVGAQNNEAGEAICMFFLLPITVPAGQKISLNCTLPKEIAVSGKTSVLMNVTYNRPDSTRYHIISGEIYAKPSSR